MLNIGGGELVVILLVALIVLGPAKLPDAVRQVGKAMGEFRRLSAGLQEEFADVLDVPTEHEARAKGRAGTESPPAPAPSDITPEEADEDTGVVADGESSGGNDSASPDETA